MSKGIRNLVSKRKRRFKEDGYDLDLSYITERLIAMGFPAQKLEGVYRNHIDDVCRFLEERHKDHYRIYNLCSERNRSYDVSRFHNRVHTFPFADHNPPPLIDIQPLCNDIGKWLSQDQKNVAVVHCKAGKGRTGVMICCYLLHSHHHRLAQEALDFYGDKRTFDRKGVTIPSQRRYVEYYAKLVSSNFNYNPPFVRLRQARMTPPLSSVNSEVFLVVSSHTNKKGYNTQVCEVKKGKELLHLPVKEEVARPISGDIKIELKRTNFVRRTDKLFSAWLNTHFIFEEGKKVSNGFEITASDQSNHNTCQPHQITRQRSNSFRSSNKSDGQRHRRQESMEGRGALSGLGGGGTEHHPPREPRRRNRVAGESKSLPTGHLTCLAAQEDWPALPPTQPTMPQHLAHPPSPSDSSPPPPHLRHHSRQDSRHRRRHHTHQLPSSDGGGRAGDAWEEGRPEEQEVLVVLNKDQLDKASKDTHHKLLPQDFKIELWWLVTYVNKGGGGGGSSGSSNNAVDSRDSGSTPSTITPSGSSSDTDDDDEEEDEDEDWDSGDCGVAKKVYPVTPPPPSPPPSPSPPTTTITTTNNNVFASPLIFFGHSFTIFFNHFPSFISNIFPVKV
ncbi:phosphatidylinositol 3,4,5-trisphosphate 3-phosphatase and dual-specificity protein phosphatase PTEN-like isoform X3 [Eriocheir sinensis]|uniref:phosphatidylinositol 3,4,5-trisphosphate 3-phosphatase and dual-specificity protein phosphatase PTEN-like isoform X3 n=1 Tax=Eriocheir sinensis TaxID=95602 RepID=UPI0021C6C847|nr:phosphatidylinositol 3,4,5-trisphosphate 3-phosphatase and dual-specificity protein phosphatase PTEN-like isoform X3 [Eriocheir sinensis]